MRQVIYSVLRPLSQEELQFLSVSILNFFSPSNNTENRGLLSLPIEKGTLRPLSIGNLFTFLKNHNTQNKSIDPYQYEKSIYSLIKKFENAGYLSDAGTSLKGGSPPMHLCYYSHIELTSLQENNLFWLGEVLGSSFLKNLVSKYTIRIEGKYLSNKRCGTGSGVLIAPDLILTCKHNITDLEEHSCWLGNQNLPIKKHVVHPKYDIGFIILSEKLTYDTYPYLGEAYILDQTLTLGYPPNTGLREATIISQNGEINAIGNHTTDNCECILISSITRPGNSGGPVFSLKGHIAGIVVNEGGSSDASTSKTIHHPFYMAISSNFIKKISKEIFPEYDLNFENYL
ncbi:hypothetical protein AAIR98_001362 [Elusimicrobium simillimum]|uniref:trypsin-like serine peptidase n=1 Tax=Elusimicrobium simillimum TaxID=3143438 RepID=UPI003C6F88FF